MKIRMTAYHDCGTPYIGKVETLENPTNKVFWVEFVGHRYQPDDRRELVHRGVLLCGFDVDNVLNFVEKQWTIFTMVKNPTEIDNLSTLNVHKPFVKTL